MNRGYKEMANSMNLKGRDLLEIVYRWKACVEMDLPENEQEYVEWIIWHRTGSSVDDCEDGNGPRDSIRRKAFLGEINNSTT